MRVVKREHVGGVVFLAEVAVQLLAFVSIHDAHGDLRIGGQSVANPARDLVAWQDGAVGSHFGKTAELQR
ncbi:hypothetical protein D3C87_1864670 [compost metagenome]